MAANQKLQTQTQEAGSAPEVNKWALPEGAMTRLGRSLTTNITFSPDENTLAVATWIGLWLYDVATLTPTALWDTQRGMLSTVAFSPDGALLSTGNKDGGITVWDVQNHQCVSKMQRPVRSDSAAFLSFSPDGCQLASSGSRHDAIHVWHITTGEQVACFTVEESLKPHYRPGRTPIAFSPDGTLIAGATPENTVSLWDIETDKRIAYVTGHTAPVAVLIFSPCGEFLVSADKSGALYEWEVHKVTAKTPSDYCSKLPTYTTSTPPLVYLTDGTLLAVGKNEETLIVWDAKRGHKVRVFQSERCPHPVCFSPNGSQLASVWEDEIQTWNLEEPAPRMSAIRGHTRVCGTVAFSPDGRTLAAGYWSGDIHLWDVARLTPQRTFSFKGSNLIRTLVFSPCGKHLVAGSHGAASVWDIGQTGTPHAVFTEDQGSQWRAVFSPKGDVLFIANSTGHLYVWQEGQNVTVLTIGQNKNVRTKHIKSLTISPDGKQIAIAYHLGAAELWDVKSRQLMKELSLVRIIDEEKYRGDAQTIQQRLRSLKKNVEGSPMNMGGPIVFSPCGDVLAGGIFGEIRFWDAATYEVRMVICLPHGCQRLEALKFSPCGRYLVSGASWQGTDKVSIRLWDVATGENIQTFWGHPTDIQDLAFSPDGTLLASGSYDGTILLWDLKPYLPYEPSKCD